MYPLTCIDGYRIPTREEVYVLDIIPFTSGPGTISSDQKLSLFDPFSLKTGPTINLVTNHGNVTCTRAFDAANSVVCTAGENGTISLWDLRQDARQAEVSRFTTGKSNLVWLPYYQPVPCVNIAELSKRIGCLFYQSHAQTRGFRWLLVQNYRITKLL